MKPKLSKTKNALVSARPRRLRWGAWLCSAAVACGVDATPADQAADADPSETSGVDPGDRPPETARTRDAGAGASIDSVPLAPGVLPESLPCAGNTLGALLGCEDAGVIPLCATDACKRALATLPDSAVLTEQIRSATEGAVAVLAQDGGAITACQWSYATCVSANTSPEGLEQCMQSARSCGYEPPPAVSLDCSARFARCFLADLFDYDRCIAVFKECEAARM